MYAFALFTALLAAIKLNFIAFFAWSLTVSIYLSYFLEPVGLGSGAGSAATASAINYSYLLFITWTRLYYSISNFLRSLALLFSLRYRHSVSSKLSTLLELIHSHMPKEFSLRPFDESQVCGIYDSRLTFGALFLFYVGSGTFDEMPSENILSNSNRLTTKFGCFWARV